MIYAVVKRVLDCSAALIGLLIASPLLIVCAVAIRMSMGCPIFFRQVRPGYGGRPFTLVKFRTMLDHRDSSGKLLPDAQRLTRVGKFIRKTSLDELPQLWNVLKGEMSLVGPRPLLMEYLPLYSPQQARRHEVKPGITGWAQVNGRNSLDWEEKFRLDVWYVDHRSFWLDLRILCMTFKRVIRRQGIAQPGHATAEPFRGATA